MATNESLFEFQTDEKSVFRLTSYSPDPDIIQCAGNGEAKITVKPGIKAKGSWAATYNQKFQYQAVAVPSTDTPEIENRKITIIIQGAAMPYDKAGILSDPNEMTVRTNSPINLSLSDVSSKGRNYCFTTRNGKPVKIELRGNYQAHWRYIDSKGEEKQLLSGYVANGAIIYTSKLWLDPGYNPILNSATYDITINDKISTIINYTK